MRIGSLFSGIGLLEKGLVDAGVGTVAWQVEVDPFCRRVLAKHYPEAVRHNDVREVGAHNLEHVDVICGGFPCTDLSTAGRGAGLDGPASGLWWEYLRVVRDVRPRFVVIENVAALLVRGLDRVLGALAESGYDATWDCIPASAVGAPHQRDRLFVVAYAQRERQPDAQLHGVAGHAGAQGEAPSESDRGRWARSLESVVGVGVDGSATGLAGRGLRFPAGMGQDQFAWESPRILKGVKNRQEKLTAVGNAVVPQVAQVVGRVVMSIAEEQC